MKFSKTIGLLCILASLFSLIACGSSDFGVEYFYEEENVKVSFPEDMKVFDLNNITPSDTDIEKYEFDYKELKEYSDPTDAGVVYYAKRHDLSAECTFSVTADDTSIAVWDLAKENSQVKKDIADNIMSKLTTSYYTLKEKAQYEKDGTYYIRFHLMSSKSKKVDTVYLFTVKNGLYYSSSYFSKNLDEAALKQALDIFGSIKFTETLEEPLTEEEAKVESNKKRLITLTLIFLSIAVAVIAVIAYISVKRQRQKELDSAEYSSQFGNILDDKRKKK